MKFTLNGQAFELPELNRTGGPSPAVATFHKALDAANSFAAAKHQVNDDPALSSVGKMAKLIPLAKALWRQHAASAKEIAAARREVEAKTAILYEVGTPTTPYQISIDKEIRDWWQGANAEKRTAFLHAVSNGTADLAMVVALLRSPVPALFDLEMRGLKEAFEKQMRDADPDLWAAIEDDGRAIDWTERGMNFVLALTYALTETNRGEVLKELVRDGDYAGAIALGFGADEFAIEKRLAAAKPAYA